MSKKPIEPEIITPIYALEICTLWGWVVGFLAGGSSIDAAYCSECKKPVSNETGLKSLAKFLGGGLVGALGGASLCALGYEFYPQQMPSQVTTKGMIKMMGLIGAYLGFLNSKDYMQESICSECEAKVKVYHQKL